MRRKKVAVLCAWVALVVLGTGPPVVLGQTENPFVVCAVEEDGGNRIKPCETIDGSQTVEGNQINPDVAAAEDGSFVVLWKDEQPPRRLVALRFNGTCEQPRNINLPNNCGGFDRAVLVSADSKTFSLMCSFPGDLKTPTFDCDGNLTPSSVMFQGKATDFAVAAQPDSDFAVVWIPEGEPQTLRWRPNAKGSRPSDESFEITIDEGTVIEPQIAVTQNGSLVITWEAGEVEDCDDDGNCNCRDCNVFVRDFDSNGEPLFFQQDTQVNLLAAGTQRHPALAILESDPVSFLLIWDSNPFRQEGSGIFVRRFRDGKGGPEIQVNSRVLGDQFEPQIAVGADGNLLAVWEDEQRSRISVQLLTPGGFPIGVQWDVDEGEEGAVLSSPRTAALPDGRFVVVWQREQQGDFDVLARIVDPPATPPCTENETTLCLHGGQYRVEVEWQSRDAFGAEQQQIDFGYFWALEEDNVELLVAIERDDDSAVLKAIGLTTLGLALTVTDTWSGRTVRHTSPAEDLFQPLLDGDSFRPRGLQPHRLLADSSRGSELGGSKVVYTRSVATLEDNGCEDGEDALSLVGGRFRIEAKRLTPDGEELGGASCVTSLVGTFSFSEPRSEPSLDAAVKILDLCDFDGHYWVFAAGLTAEPVEITVRDTVLGQEEILRDPAGFLLQPVFRTLPCS